MVWFVQGMNFYPSDWPFHLAGTTTSWTAFLQGVYPPFSPWITHIFYENGLIALWSAAIFVIIPYVLILAFTKDEKYPLCYLYISGIPWILCAFGFFAETIVQNLMLLNLFSPILWPFTFALMLETHREAVGAFVVSVLLWAIIRFRDKLGIKMPYKPAQWGI